MSSTEYPDLPPVAADAHGSARGTWLLWAGLMLATVMTWRLGEGSGCPLLFRVMEASCGVMSGMATFAEAAIQDDYLDEIRAGDSFTVDRP